MDRNNKKVANAPTGSAARNTSHSKLKVPSGHHPTGHQRNVSDSTNTSIQRQGNRTPDPHGPIDEKYKRSPSSRDSDLNGVGTQYLSQKQ
jgi:hypothetical protein